MQEVENERLGGERTGSNTKSSYIIKPIEQRGAEMDRTLVITALQLELEQLLNNFNFHLHVEHEIKR